MGRYSIKDLEKLSGVKAHTLRIWEQRYDIVKPKRSPTNIRYYDDEDLQLLLNISFLNRNGLKISKIARMDVNEIRHTVKRISSSNLDFPNQVNALIIAMVNLDEERFEKIVATNTLQFGFEQTMLQIVYPFLKQIGILWQTGSINPAHEHFISNLIRQKLIVAIDGQISPPNPQAKKYLLFLPEGELHELSLLFSAYLIKSRHNRAIYLGQNLPSVDLPTVLEVYKPDYVFTVLTSYPSNQEILAFINNLQDICQDSQLLLSGYQAITRKGDIDPSIPVFSDMKEFIAFLEERSPKPFVNMGEESGEL